MYTFMSSTDKKPSSLSTNALNNALSRLNATMKGMTPVMNLGVNASLSNLLPINNSQQKMFQEIVASLRPRDGLKTNRLDKMFKHEIEVFNETVGLPQENRPFRRMSKTTNEEILTNAECFKNHAEEILNNNNLPDYGIFLKIKQMHKMNLDLKKNYFYDIVSLNHYSIDKNTLKINRKDFAQLLEEINNVFKSNYETIKMGQKKYAADTYLDYINDKFIECFNKSNTYNTSKKEDEVEKKMIALNTLYLLNDNLEAIKDELAAASFQDMLNNIIDSYNNKVGKTIDYANKGDKPNRDTKYDAYLCGIFQENVQSIKNQIENFYSTNSPISETGTVQVYLREINKLNQLENKIYHTPPEIKTRIEKMDMYINDDVKENEIYVMKEQLLDRFTEEKSPYYKPIYGSLRDSIKYHYTETSFFFKKLKIFDADAILNCYNKIDELQLSFHYIRSNPLGHEEASLGGNRKKHNLTRQRRRTKQRTQSKKNTTFGTRRRRRLRYNK